jgi:hypothetical protein
MRLPAERRRQCGWIKSIEEPLRSPPNITMAPWSSARGYTEIRPVEGPPGDSSSEATSSYQGSDWPKYLHFRQPDGRSRAGAG